MISRLRSFFIRTEEITGFEDVNPTEIPFITLTYYHYTQGVELLQKISAQKGNEKRGDRGLHNCTDIF